MVTTIQVSKQLQHALQKRKMYDRESYEEIIWDLIEDSLELSEGAKKEVEAIRARMIQGKYHTHEEVKKKLGVA